MHILKQSELDGMPCPDTLIHGECLEAMKHIADGSVDMTVFSPPYDSIRDYHAGWEFDPKAMGDALFRVTKPGGVCAVVIGDGTKNFAKSLTSFRLVVDWCDRAGWKLFECCIYQRCGTPGGWWSQRFRVDHEYIFIFFKGDRPKTFHKEHLMVPSKHAGKMYTGTDRLTNGTTRVIEPKAVNPFKCRGTIWPYATSNSEGNKLKLKHPATYPDKLAEDLILCFTEPGDLVLDPMMGSGTTPTMALRNGRDFLGNDISAEYHAIARARVDAEGTNQATSLFKPADMIQSDRVLCEAVTNGD